MTKTVEFFPQIMVQHPYYKKYVRYPYFFITLKAKPEQLNL
jgi:hypothetical protein